MHRLYLCSKYFNFSGTNVICKCNHGHICSGPIFKLHVDNLIRHHIIVTVIYTLSIGTRPQSFGNIFYIWYWFQHWYWPSCMSLQKNISNCMHFNSSEHTSWLSWLYGSCIYNYLSNQCLSPLMLRVWILLTARCTRYNIMWSSLPVICVRSVVYPRVLRFPPSIKTDTQYNWNIVESGVKHHNTNPLTYLIIGNINLILRWCMKFHVTGSIRWIYHAFSFLKIAVENFNLYIRVVMV